MRPTLQYIREKFGYYNQLCFDGKLPELTFRFIDRKGCMGRTVCEINPLSGKRYFEIQISVRFDLPEEEYIDTLIHEMIHYYIMFYDLKDNGVHGDLFKSIMTRITTTYGVRITIAYNPDPEEQPLGRYRLHFVCVIGFPDGQVGFCVIAKNKVFENWLILENSPQIDFFEWYVSFDPYFEAYSTVVSLRPNIVEKSTLYRHLLTSDKLAKEGNRIFPERK